MITRDIVRIAVVKTNPYWPFSRVNRVPYHLAIRAFLQLCKGFSEIRSVYLRHGMLEDDWVPAISDIDLTVIIRGDLTTEEELTFLQTFWRDHDRLMKIFPMLQDVLILNEEQVASWTKFGIQGYESGSWRLLHGVETVESEYVVDPTRLATDAFNYGLRFYLGYFLSKFYEDGPPSLRSQQLQRLGRKILQYAGYASPSDRDRLASDRRIRDEAETVAWVIKGLEERIPGDASLTGVNGAANNSARIRHGAEVAVIGADDQDQDIRKLAAVSEAIDGILRIDGDYTVVVRDGLGEAAIRNCVDLTRRVFHPRGMEPVIVSNRMFTHLLRIYSPHRYGRATTRGNVVLGRDVRVDIRPPDARAIVANVLDLIPYMLKFPRRRQFMSTPGVNLLQVPGMAATLGEGLLIKLYLEAGMTASTRGELLAETRTRYPEYYERFEEIREGSPSVDGEISRRRLFGLFVGMARDIDRGVRDGTGLEEFWTRGR